MWRIMCSFLKPPCRSGTCHCHSYFISQSKAHATPTIKGAGQSNPTMCPEGGLEVLNDQH